MNLITAKCPDCGAALKIPEGSSTVTCEFCGSQVIVTDILGTNSIMQNCMTLAYAALEAKNYKDAYGHFNSALEISTTNFSAWYGKAICTGMTGKLIEFRIDEMIKLFETAFKYAPADKLANIRRNAAAEIVKAINAQKENFKMQQTLLSVEKDMDGPSFSFKEFEAESEKVRQEFIGALDKAREYDPSNTDITPLQNEFTQPAQVAGEPLGVQQTPIVQQTPLESFNTAGELLKKIEEPPPVQPQVNENKKSGCAFMSFMSLFIIFAFFGIVIFLLGK